MSEVDLNKAKARNENKYDNFEEDFQEEIIDPRVQIELERLNASTVLINQLEIELDDARSNFRQLLNDSSVRINTLVKKLGSCIEKAKPYYESRMKAKQLQTQTQKAALRYERASSAHSAAKEMVNIAEEGLKKEGSCFDPAWQEMLNHATLRVNEAESERVFSQHEHQKVSFAYNETEKVIQRLHQDLRKAIIKSSLSTRRSLLQLNNLANQHQLQLLPYFEMKAEFNLLLEDQRKKVNILEENVLKAKMSYADALHNLEEISDEIHMKRRTKDSVGNSYEDMDDRKNFRLNNIEMSKRYSSTNSSTEDVYYDDMKSEDIFANLPSELQVRSSIIKTTCSSLGPEIALCRRNSFPEIVEVSSSDSVLHNTGVKRINSDETVLPNADYLKDQKKFSYEVSDSSCISTQKKHLSKSTGDTKDLVEDLSNVKVSLSLREKVPDQRVLVPDFNILRVQREEISDSESLNSNDTADTLDDCQIECLLLDKSLPLDFDSSSL